MKYILLMFLLFAVSLRISAQTVYGFGPQSRVDRYSHVSTIGIFQDYIAFPDTVIFSHTYYPSAFLASFDEGLRLRWFRNLAGLGIKDLAIAVDSGGATYVAGAFEGIVRLDDATTLSAASGDETIFLAKYDTSGTLKWYKKETGVSSTTKIGLGIDSLNNVYLCSGFKTWLTFGADTVSHAFEGAFLAKFDSAGNDIWLSKLPGVKKVMDMETDAAGNCYITGSCTGLQICDTQTLNTPVETAFLIRCSAAGVPQWQRLAVGSAVDAYSVALGQNNTPVIFGYFNDTVDFGTIPKLHRSGTENKNMYLAHYDEAGNDLRAIKGAPRFIRDQRLYQSAGAEHGNSYFSYKTYEPWPPALWDINSDTISTFPYHNAIIVKTDTALSELCHINLSGKLFAPGVHVAPNGDLYVTGLAELLMMNGDAIHQSLEQKIYIARFDKDCQLIDTLIMVTPWVQIGAASNLQANDFVNIYPNPTGGKVNVQFSDKLAGKAVVFIRDMMGRVLQTQDISQQLSTIDITALPPGMYMAEIVTGDKRVVKMLTKE